MGGIQDYGSVWWKCWWTSGFEVVNAFAVDIAGDRRLRSLGIKTEEADKSDLGTYVSDGGVSGDGTHLCEYGNQQDTS